MGGDLAYGLVAELLVLVYKDWLLTWVTGPRLGGSGWESWWWHCGWAPNSSLQGLAVELSDWPKTRRKWVGILVMSLFEEPLVLVYKDWLLTWVTGPGPGGSGWGSWLWHCGSSPPAGWGVQSPPPPQATRTLRKQYWSFYLIIIALNRLFCNFMPVVWNSPSTFYDYFSSFLQPMIKTYSIKVVFKRARKG